MKILMVAPDLPYPLNNGGKIRTHHLLKNLALNNELTLVAFDRYPEEPSRQEELESICRKVIAVPLHKRQQRSQKRKTQLLSLFRKRPYQYFNNFSEEMQRVIDRCLAEEQYDVVHVVLAQMGYYFVPKGPLYVLDQQNVEYEILYRTYVAEKMSIRKIYNFSEWRKFQHDEANICRKVDLCLTPSLRDSQILKKHAPQTHFTVVPNGVDSTYFQDSGKHKPVKASILFTGTIDYYPNTDGLRYFLTEIFPLIKERIPTVQFYIAGKDPPPEIARYATDPNIIVTGFVEDIREYFERSQVVVVPLRIGGGTRLKILEAMAMKKPVVSTPIGAEGLDVEEGENILLEEDPAKFAKAVFELINNIPLQKQLGVAGRQLIEQKYDWYSVATNLEATYRELTSKNEATI